ncbi:hypothetical protein NL386_25845, partial [Klebsiella pneumoniae]|nr:hypothetical protein [Klebsiella pneumoniae]
GTVCVVGKMRDLILQLSKSSIYSTKPSRIQNPDTAIALIMLVSLPVPVVKSLLWAIGFQTVITCP